MKRRNGRRVGLGFQWNADCWDLVGSLSDPLFARLGAHPVHWILPSFPAETSRKPTPLVRSLLSRVSAGTDRVIARGFAGACHPLLNLDELEREISWGVKNPWLTGTADVLESRPSILAPPVPDLLRPGAWELYRQLGFRLIGICPESAVRPAGDPPGCFFYSRVDVGSVAPGTPEWKRMRKLFTAAEASFIVLDLTGVRDQTRFARVLDELSATILAPESGLTLLPEMGDLPSSAPAPSGWRLDWTLFPIPRLHAELGAVAGMARKKRKKSEEYRDLLQHITPTAGPQDGPPGSAGAASDNSSRRQRLVAVMPGEVTLAGSAFDVRLSGGRFAGAVRRGKELLPRRPAQSYLRIRGTASCLRTLSSFSFESDAGTGLREELGIDGRDGAVVCIEYSFRDDSPSLWIAAELRLPDFGSLTRIEEYVPLSIALRDLGRRETVTVESTAPDESRATVSLGEGADWVLMPGAAHRIQRSDGGWIVLRHSSPAGRRWGVPFFRVVRTRAGSTLEVNPFGSFAPVSGAELRGRRESLTLLLGLEEA